MKKFGSSCRAIQLLLGGAATGAEEARGRAERDRAGPGPR